MGVQNVLIWSGQGPVAGSGEPGYETASSVKDAEILIQFSYLVQLLKKVYPNVVTLRTTY